ncbi:hypothetical protein ABW20_dc0105324 [Dactylellina cionopaga]|nr:hypothetical protein ABW20_dc0105324 [Dactylellina cionopaga]
MDMFSGILTNQAPPKQTAATTIATLCDRLLHATLLEDRRAAVLGLRSFAREYKESVASGGLRGLIGTLAKDSEDVDTVKVVLETLLLLFAREDGNTDSPDDIALWLADEFTQALSTVADLIRGNHALQENFALTQVDASSLPGFAVPDASGKAPRQTAYVIEALLNMALLDTNPASFNLRMAAVQCIEGYVHNNVEIRLHFLDRAVKGFTSGEDETANVFNALIELDSDSRADPYRTWFSGAIFLTLIFGDREAQDLAMKLTSGDAESGEEVVTAIQTFSSNLVSALQYGLDPRISLTFLMILCVWLYENPEAVDDFLNENSTIESLVTTVNQLNNADIVLQGVCTFLIGIVFEFSTKESPIPRVDLHSRILGRLKKDQYFLKLHKLRQYPAVRDFEVMSSQQHRKGLPEVYFTSDFITFFKDNYSIISRSLDRDPGDTSGHHANGETNMVSTEMLQSVTAQLETKEGELSKLQAAHISLEHQLSQEQEKLRNFRETSSATVQRIKEVAAREIASARDEAQNIQEQAEADLLEERETHRSEMQEVTLRMDAALRESRAAADKITKETSVVVTKLQDHTSQLENELGGLRDENTIYVQQINDMKNAILKLESQLNEQFDNYKKLQSRHESEKEVERKAAERQLADLKREMEERFEDTAKTVQESTNRAEKAELEIIKVREAAKKETEAEKEKAAAAQGEVEDLMLVMADLEENMKKYKSRLKKLGEEVTDDEDADEEDDEEGGDEDDDDVE